MEIDATRQRVIGQWPGIFSQLGIDVGTGKHQPCVLCGGTDRFRFDDKDGNGTYICGQCGAGNGWTLIQKYYNLDFIQSIKKVSEILGVVDMVPYVEPKKQDPTKALNELWKSSTKLTGSDPVSKYLHSRGLVLTPTDARYCPTCYESDSKTEMQAMVCLVRDVQGKAVTIHRTYLQNGGKAGISSPKKLMPGKDKVTGCAIRLFPPKDNLIGVAEGVETAIACTQLHDIPTWACISSTILESFEPPEGIRKIVIYGDCDANFTGQKSAYVLANRLYLKDYIVNVEIPGVGDWADKIETKT